MTEPVILIDGVTAESALQPDDVTREVRAAYVALSQGEARLFPLVRESLQDGAIYGLRSAYWPSRNLLGLKTSGYFPGNRDRGEEAHQALVVLIDPATGNARAIVDGNVVTRLRTAAAGALGTVTLAPARARTVLVIGNGIQAEAQIVAHASMLAERDPRFLVFAPRDPSGGRAAQFAARLQTSGIEVLPTVDLAAALAQAQIVVTATTSTEPLFSSRELPSGMHITAIGSDAPGKREIEPAILVGASVFSDSVQQSQLFGELQGQEEATRAAVEIGDVLRGARPGREADDQTTLFDSTGVALLDLVTAELAVANAREPRLTRV